MRILAVIPARAGSKGIPNKNIALLNGNPLISYSINEALKIKNFKRVFISTDSQEIADLCLSLGIDVPFLRSKELGGDSVKTIDVILDVLKNLENNFGESYDYVCLLQPTSPLRKAFDIQQCIKLIKKKSPESVVSLSLIDEPHPLKMKKIVDGLIKPYHKMADSSVPRQELPKVYELNGAVYITKTETLRKEKSFFGHKSIPYLMPKERSININNPFDLKLAEMILRNHDDKKAN